MSLQFDNKARCILVSGCSGSGKSSYVVKYLLNAKFTCVFIFDPRGEYAARFKRRAACIPAELAALAQSGLVIFDPHTMYPGGAATNFQKAFEDFCDFTFSMSGLMGGQKILFVDEMWRHCSPNKIPLALATIVQDGRKNGVGLITSTQRANRLNEAILTECTEGVYFRMKGGNARDSLMEIDDSFPYDEVLTLPDMHFIAHDLNTGGELRGVVKL